MLYLLLINSIIAEKYETKKNIQNNGRPTERYYI